MDCRGRSRGRYRRGHDRGHRTTAGKSEQQQGTAAGQIPGNQTATTVRTGTGAGAVPPVAQQVPVVAAARTVHDNAVQGAQPEGVHKRGRRQARDTVADVGTITAHQVGPITRLQYARGHFRAMRRLFIGRQRVFFR